MNSSPRASLGGGAPLVLVADNDVGVNELLREVLAERGLRTESVFDGADALRRLMHGDVTLLVCDLDMPTMAGEELLRHMQDLPGAPPAIVVSGFLDPATEQRLAALPGVRATFAKPFDVFAFAARARDLATSGGSRVVESGG